MIKFLDYNGDYNLNWRLKVENLIKDDQKDKKGFCACVVDRKFSIIGFGIFKDENKAVEFLDDVLLKEKVFSGATKSHIFDIKSKKETIFIENVSLGPSITVLLKKSSF